MDWTDTKHEASGVNLATKVQEFARDNPAQFSATATGLGLLSALTGGALSVGGPFAAFRTQAPIAYRAGAYGPGALASYAAPPLGIPMLLAQLYQEPAAHRFYHDRVQPPAPDEDKNETLAAVLMGK